MAFTYLSIDDMVLTSTGVVQGSLTLKGISNTSVNTDTVSMKVCTYGSSTAKYWFECYGTFRKKSSTIVDTTIKISSVYIASSGSTVSWQTFVTQELNNLPNSSTMYSIQVYLTDKTTALGTTRPLTIKFSPTGDFRPTINVAKLYKSDTSDCGYIGTGMTAGTDCSKFLQGYSKIRCVVPSITTKMGATITGYNITIADIGSVDFTWSSMTFTLENHPDAYGQKKMTFTVTDSRGLKSSITETINILPYHKPILLSNTSMRANNGVGTTFYMNFKVDWAKTGLTDTQVLDVSADGGGATMPEFVYESSEAPYTVSNVAFAQTIPTTETLAITITMTDQITTTTFVISVPVASPVMSIRAGMVGINNGDPGSALDVVGDIAMNGFNVLGYRGYISAGESGAVASSCTDSTLPTGAYAVLADADDTPEADVGGYMMILKSTYTLNNTVYTRGVRMFFTTSNNVYHANAAVGSWGSWKQL